MYENILMALMAFMTKGEAETTINNFCENAFWTPKVNNEKVIELCETTWRDSFPNAYNLNK